jgi:alkylation response protein AidB-like acyl-CoA dehydrogenase
MSFQDFRVERGPDFEKGGNVDEREAFRAEVREFLSSNAERRRDVSMWAIGFHTSEEEGALEFAAGRVWQRKMFDHRLAGITYPRELGGRGGEAWQEAVYNEEAANFDVSSGYVASTIAMLGPTLMKWATPEQKARLVPRLLSAEDGYCQLFSEPGAGSDLASLACRAVRDGDEFVVNGQKVWSSAAQWCSRGMLLVRTDPDAPKHRGITFLLLDMDTPGVEVRRLVQPTGARHFNEVFLSNVRVPVGNVIGDINDGWHVARTVLSNESAFIGGASSGSLFERLRTLSQMFGRSEQPSIRQDLAVAFMRERILGLMGERILAAVRRREPPPIDPSILKLYLAESRAQTGNLALNIMGAGGMASAINDEVSRWARAELFSRFTISIGGGTNEVLRNNLAERALGLPREPQPESARVWRDIPRN